MTPRAPRGDTRVTRTVLEPENNPAAAPPPSPAPTPTPTRQQRSALDDLASACRRAGLTARFDTLTAEKARIIASSVDIHGVEPLVRAALHRRRPHDPARSAAAWIPTWQALPPPRPKLPPTCGTCDEHGWLPDDHLGRAVRCACRRMSSEHHREAMVSAA